MDILVIPDAHAHKDYPNHRADWLGKFICQRKPDIVVNIGDTFDMPSLSSFDKGKASFNGASYEQDINAGLEFLDRVWTPVKQAKKKQPYKVFLEGNHEHRLNKVLEQAPEMKGDRYGYSYSNYQLEEYHHEVVYYDGSLPGQYSIGGFSFAHYFPSGLMGRPVGGKHHASSLLAENHESSVCGHSHTADLAFHSTSTGRKIMGVVTGVFQDYDSPWAGQNICNLWWRGIVYLHDVEAGMASPEFISLERLRREYSK